jgi:hypothetical protein
MNRGDRVYYVWVFCEEYGSTGAEYYEGEGYNKPWTVWGDTEFTTEGMKKEGFSYLDLLKITQAIDSKHDTEVFFEKEIEVTTQDRHKIKNLLEDITW